MPDITPTQALAQLQGQTRNFLEHYAVRIFGDPSQHGVVNYRIAEGGRSHRPGELLRTKRMHDTQMFEIKSRGAAGGDNPQGSVWFTAHSVKMFASNDLGGIQFYTLPAAGGPNLMVTGQLTGCAFVIHDNGDGSLVATHIRPNDTNLPSGVLRDTLKKNDYWDVVYGRGDYAPDRSVSIVGIRAGTRWKVFAQKQDRMSGDYSIRKVKQIY